MKKLLLLIAAGLLYTANYACSCFEYEPNFYKNISSHNSYCFGVVKYKTAFEYNNLISTAAYVQIIDTIGLFPNKTGDMILVTGHDGLNCGEDIATFQNGDSIILGLQDGFYNAFASDTFYLDGCGANHLKTKDGECNKLGYEQIKQRYYSIKSKENQQQACFNMYVSTNFYENLSNKTYNCIAVFNGYNYSFSENGIVAQTGSFKLIDTIGSFDINNGENFTIIGENGLNCGQMLSEFAQNDTMFLTLSGKYDTGELLDTFYLLGGRTGQYYLNIKNGTNNGLTITEIKNKITMKILDIELAQINKEIKVYPNPTNKILMIESGEIKISSVEAYDINGKLLFDFGNINDTYAEFDISDIVQGIISLNIFTTRGMITKKVVKE